MCLRYFVDLANLEENFARIVRTEHSKNLVCIVGQVHVTWEKELNDKVIRIFTRTEGKIDYSVLCDLLNTPKLPRSQMLTQLNRYESCETIVASPSIIS